MTHTSDLYLLGSLRRELDAVKAERDRLAEQLAEAEGLVTYWREAQETMAGERTTYWHERDRYRAALEPALGLLNEMHASSGCGMRPCTPRTDLCITRNALRAALQGEAQHD